MKFVILLLFVLIGTITAAPPSTESKSEPDSEVSSSEMPDETDVTETPVRESGKPKCRIFFTRMFGNDNDGNGRFLNRRFPINFFPNYNSENGGFGRNGYDDGYSRRSFIPFYIFRNKPGYDNRRDYNPTNDQPDPKDVEFVRS